MAQNVDASELFSFSLILAVFFFLLPPLNGMADVLVAAHVTSLSLKIAPRRGRDAHILLYVWEQTLTVFDSRQSRGNHPNYEPVH